MTSTVVEDWLVTDAVVPSTRGPLAPLYEHGAEGRLAMPFCGACDQALELEQATCDACGARQAKWRPVEPAGVVHSVTTVHRRERALLRTDRPYHVVDVELRSGHRIVMTTLHPTDESPAIGDRVKIGFRSVGGVAVPAVCLDDLPATDTEVPR
jgi:uncharacterized OB-fold protein